MRKFQIAALQAVMADLLSGDTVHRALNIGMLGNNKTKQDYNGEDNRKSMEVSRQILQRRWLIINVSLVSARLLADVDVKLRSLVPSSSTHRTNPHGVDRPFGRFSCHSQW